MAKRKQYVVLGLGRFGLSVARTLSENGFDVLAAGNDPEAVQVASEFVTHAVCIDVTDDFSMKALGIGNFDVAIVAIGHHLEASVMATLQAKEMGIPFVVAKAQDDAHKRILEKIGADRVIFPEREMGMRIANNLMYGNFFEFMELSNEVGIAEFEPIREWVGKTLAQSEIRAKYDLNVVAIRHNGKIDASLKPNREIMESDILIVMGENRQIQRLIEKNAKGGSN